MITPGLWRRSLKRAAQWRLLTVWLAGIFLAASAALLPLWAVLGEALDHTPRAKALVAVLDQQALVDLVRVLGDAANALRPGAGAMMLLTFFLAPLAAAAAVGVARSPEPPRFASLLGQAGEYYSRMLRLSIVGLIPLGIAFGISGAIMAAATKRGTQVFTETSASNGSRGALIVSVVLVFVAHLLLDLARGTFAAQPERWSAFRALWHAVRVFVRRPLQVIGMGFVGTVSALIVAAILVALRQRIVQGSGGTVLLAFVVSQLSVAAIGWGRAARIIGFAELVRADAAERARWERPVASAQIVPAAATPIEPVLPPAEPAALAPAEPGRLPAVTQDAPVQLPAVTPDAPAEPPAPTGTLPPTAS